MRRVQTVINSEQHFRRAFADVFRRRSFLFLGSGLKEDYLVNLFSEILLTFGAGSLPHYAMFTKKEAEGHADFLQTRLNVTPIIYDDYPDLPRLLADLGEACSHEALETFPAGRLEERRLLGGAWFTLTAQSLASVQDAGVPKEVAGKLTTLQGKDFDRKQFVERLNHVLDERELKDFQNRILKHAMFSRPELVLRWGGLLCPEPEECVAFSVGRGDRGSLAIGAMGRGYLDKHHPGWENDRATAFVQDPNMTYIYQYSQHRVFAVAARHATTDARDLRTIAPAVKELLKVAAHRGMRKVHSGLIAAGPSRKWHQTFSLIEMLRGARMAAESLGKDCPSLVINIVDPAVWFPLQAQKLGVDDILAGPNVKVLG